MPRTTRNSLHSAYYAGDIAPYNLGFIVTTSVNPMSLNHRTSVSSASSSDDEMTLPPPTPDSPCFAPTSPVWTPDPELDVSDIHTEMTDESIVRIINSWLEEVSGDSWIKFVTRPDDENWKITKLRIFPQGHFTCYLQMKIYHYVAAINKLCHDEMVEKYIQVQFVDNEKAFNEDF